MDTWFVVFSSFTGLRLGHQVQLYDDGGDDDDYYYHYYCCVMWLLWFLQNVLPGSAIRLRSPLSRGTGFRG